MGEAGHVMAGTLRCAGCGDRLSGEALRAIHPHRRDADGRLLCFCHLVCADAWAASHGQPTRKQLAAWGHDAGVIERGMRL